MNARQALYDAIKQARTEGEAWVTYRGERLRIRPLREEDTEARQVTDPPPPDLPLGTPVMTLGEVSYWCPGAYVAFVKVRGGWGVALGEVWWHEGRLHLYDGERTRRGNDDLVLALVLERHARPA